MYSSNGFIRANQQQPSNYYSSQMPMSQQLLGSPRHTISSQQLGHSYGRNQVNNYPGMIGGTQYLHPQAGLSSLTQSRPLGSSVLGASPSYNNFVDPRPISYSKNSYSPSKVVQAPPTAISSLANHLPPQIQPLYSQTSPAKGGFHHPNLFEQSAIKKQMDTTQLVRKFNNPINASESQTTLNEVQLDRIRVYKKQNIERVFGRDVTIECNYEPQKLFSTKELRGNLVNGFQEFEKNLQQLETKFSGLESSFFHLMHKGDSPKDLFDKFLVTLDKRVEKFFESFDETVIQNRGLATDYYDTSVMRNDYEFWNFKTVVKQGILEVSNKLNDLFLLRDNSSYYDAQVIRTIETITKVYQFLKSDLNTVLNKSILKCGKILEACTYNYENGEGLKTINFADFVQLDIAQLLSQYSDEFERTYPVLLNKKQVVTEKFHDILKDKSVHSQFDLKQLVRSVFSRERKKLYRTVYNAIVKNGKSSLDLNEDMHSQNKSITDKMNKIKNKYITIKNNPLYTEVLSGRINLEYLKNSPTLLEDNSQSVVYLEKFMVESQQFFEDIKDTLSDIIYYKSSEQERNKETLSTILSKAVYDLNQQERIIQDKGDMSELILYQFQVLEKSLNSDNSRQNVDNDLENTMMKQLKNNQGNYHLHNVAADLVRLEKQKKEQRKAQKEGQLKKTKEYSQQIANLITKPMIDKERTMHPIKDYSNQHDDDKYNSGSSSIKGLADKLLQTIKQRRQEDLDKEQKLKDEQEQVRYLKEQQNREERERLDYEKQKAIENTTKKFQERRDKEQNELQQRIQQRQKEEQDRREQNQERQKEEENRKQKAEDDRRRQKEEQEYLRKAQEEEEKLRKQQDDERRKQREQDDKKRNDDLKRQKEEDEKRRQQERDDNLKRQKEEDDRRKKLQADEDQRRKLEEEERRKQKDLDDIKRKQKDDEDRKKQQQADEERKRKIEEEDKKRQEEQRKRDEQRKLQQEEDEKKRKQQQEEEKQRQEELKKQREADDLLRKQKAEEDEKRRKKEDEERRKQKEEDEKRREEERKVLEEERRKQKEQDDQRKKEEEDRKKKQKEEDDRKKKEEDERKKKEEDDRKKKEQDDKKKKEEEDRKKKEEEDRKKREEEDKKKKQEEEDRKRKQEKEEEEKMLKKLKEQEEAASKKAKEEQDAKKKKESGFSYGDIGGSDDSGSLYKDEFEDDDEVLDKKKDKGLNKPNNAQFDQDDLYEDIGEDSDNFNNDFGKAKQTIPKATTKVETKKPEPSKKNNQFDDDFEIDDNFDDFDGDDLEDTKQPNKPDNKLPSLPITKKGDDSKRSNNQNSYDDDFEDFDESANKKKNQNQNTSQQQNKKSDKKQDDFDEYNLDFEDIEEDIMGDTTNKNDNSAVKTKPSDVKKPTTLQDKDKDKNKKQSNFDYDYDLDFDDDDENAQDNLEKDFKKGVQSQPQKNNANKKKEDDDLDYEFPEEDGDDFNEGEGEEQQYTQEQMQQIMEAQQQQQAEHMQQEAEHMQLTYELIQKTNEYIKKTRFGRSNKVNLSKYNTYEHVHLLYEEHIQGYQVHLFDYPESKGLLDLYEIYNSQEDDFQAKVEEYTNEIQRVYYENTQLTDFCPQSKLYFPLEANSISISLIEVSLMNQTVSYFFMSDQNEENLNEELFEFHKFFTYIFGFDNFQSAASIIEDDTLKVLQIYEQEPHLQYMIMLFPLVYEFMSDMAQIHVEQNTIDRIFYIQLSLEYFYEELKTNEEAVNEKFDKILEQYSSHQDFLIDSKDYEGWSPEVLEQILQDMDQIKSSVLDTDKKYGLVFFTITAGQSQLTFYFYVQKSNDNTTPHEIGLFCQQLSEQINDSMAGAFDNLSEENVEFRPHVENSRHNGLYEYHKYTISTWAHLIDKKNLSPFIALNIINFSMVPYYITYKGLD